MKDDLKRLVNEFIDETWEERTKTVEIQHTNDSPITKEKVTDEPTFQDLIWWLNK